MKKFDLNAYGVEEMGVNEMCTVDGGLMEITLKQIISIALSPVLTFFA